MLSHERSHWENAATMVLEHVEARCEEEGGEEPYMFRAYQEVRILTTRWCTLISLL